MLSKDASLDTFNTTSGRIRWISWMNLGITRMGGVLAYRPEFRGCGSSGSRTSVRQ